ncbi:hypothetical protein NDU88_004438 [Pleurodeles waltl]|uniref:Uncharacterized protein n=1 Tax=Pleurodeles waltl TaxID=8319 RepID=A0AAV7WU57_PLEWA|nr:hypothetical protein NDU88_004438 [Pleurodeles waltl]
MDGDEKGAGCYPEEEEEDVALGAPIASGCGQGPVRAQGQHHPGVAWSGPKEPSSGEPEEPDGRSEKYKLSPNPTPHQRLSDLLQRKFLMMCLFRYVFSFLSSSCCSL